MKDLIAEIFEKRVLDDSQCYRYEETTTTYKEFFQLVAGIKTSVLELQGDKRQTPVLLFGHKDVTMPASIYACITLGRPYIPIDVTTPLHRIEDIIELSDAPLLLDCRVGDHDKINLKIDQLSVQTVEKKETSSEFLLESKLTKDELIYIFFTSGSTGKPKGVMLPYEAINDFIQWWSEDYFLQSDGKNKTYLNHCLYTFDVSEFELWGSFLMGGRILALDHKNNGNPRMNIEIMKKACPDIWVSTPSFADLCLYDKFFNSESLPGIKYFVFCGEPLTKRTAQGLLDKFPGCRVFNFYGPTEATVATTAVEVTQAMIDDEKPLPIGHSKTRSEVHFLNEDNTEVASGEIGEICVSGPNLAKGYIKLPDKTAEVFTSFDSKNIYKTGDYGYLDANGMIYCKGRKDRQIKFHGYRIELDEIEEAIKKDELVNQIAVIEKRNKQNLVTQIAAAVVLSDGADASTDELKKRAGETLPPYMVPEKFYILDELPHNKSGKIDRNQIKKNLWEK